MAAMISSHNTKVLKPDSDPNTRTCSCRNKQQCPLEGNCLAECIVCQATVTAATKPTRHYFGLTEGNFKTRYNTHMHSFHAEQCRKATELSKYVWDLKSEGTYFLYIFLIRWGSCVSLNHDWCDIYIAYENLEYDIKWKLVQKSAPYRCCTRRSDICLSEKMVIATADPSPMLNKRAEIISTCRHRTKFRYTKYQRAQP